MEKEPSFEQTAERIVSWAARHPLSAAETEKRYAHLLAGLPPIPARTPEWAIFTLGKLAVRYWKDRVEDFQQALDDRSPSAALAFRGSGSAEAGAERVLRAEGQAGAACVKLTENPDHATVALVLWVEPKKPNADLPFLATVFDADQVIVAGPVECAGRSVVRFASVEPVGEYSIVFKTEAETWQIRLVISAA
jgi:hypothetical protein